MRGNRPEYARVDRNGKVVTTPRSFASLAKPAGAPVAQAPRKAKAKK